MTATLTRLCAAAALLGAASAQPLAALRLRVEYLDGALAIDVPAPRVSWAVAHGARAQAQSAYQVVFAALPSGAVAWDSGVVRSNRTLNVAYAGAAPLADDADFSVTVTWWDAAGARAPAASTRFSTGLAARASWAGAAFVAGAPRPAGAASASAVGAFADSLNMLRAEFTLAAAPVRARLFVAGFGYYRAFLNGAPTDAHVLGPFTTFEERVLYDAADVLPLVRAGCNALGVLLGAGWVATPTVAAGNRSFAALLSVAYADGSRASFASALSAGAGALVFSSAASPVTLDDIYAGEAYDARLEQPGFASCGFAPPPAAAPWLPAVAPAPDPLAGGAALSAHTIALGVDRAFAPVSISEPLPGIFVADFAQNLAGQLALNVICAAGPQTIRLSFAEMLFPENGTVHNPYKNTAMQANFTCAGTGSVERYTTLFSWFGFRYAQIENWPGAPSESNFEALFVHSLVEQTGALSTSSALLNRVQHATRMASLSNLLDVPSDCPQRERRGWLGDGQLSAETTIANFDMAAL